MIAGNVQGDQIGRFFAYWEINCCGWTVFQNYRRSALFGDYFFQGKRCAYILTKLGWATFWPILSQTHPVTLEMTAITWP
jgi:hypothetical protein